MAQIESVREMIELMDRYHQANQTIGFVPTMGALHEGHLSLVRQSLKECHTTVVSIFVNPTQFGPNEDLEKYPRTLEEDRKKLEELHVDILFLPQEKDIYPPGYDTYVIQENLTRGLCGAHRPGHFRGVLTIVLKLFHIVRPHIAYFGQKDFQQSVVIRRMVRDFHLPVKIRVMPTVREPDGLAMSSRNKYLSPEDRKKALCLYESLCLAKKMVQEGERNAQKIKERVLQKLSQVDGAKVDYVEIVEPHNLRPVEEVRKGAVMALAVWIGQARLIDNDLLL
ncbi:MAG: pantoate--beta-alanine ligase [Planctomycetota bacterium]|nr:MAG: pantoate--beta-alanine ligase [Planctomycetota bacterium]